MIAALGKAVTALAIAPLSSLPQAPGLPRFLAAVPGISASAIRPAPASAASDLPRLPPAQAQLAAASAPSFAAPPSADVEASVAAAQGFDGFPFARSADYGQTVMVPDSAGGPDTRVYRSHMKAVEDPALVKRLLAAQEALTQAHLAKVGDVAKTVESQLNAMIHYPRLTSAPVAAEGGGPLLFTFNPTNSAQDSFYSAKSIDGPRELILDPNAHPDLKGLIVEDHVFSPDGKRLALAVSQGGSDSRTWKVFDVAAKQFLPDTVENSRFVGVAWAPDGSGFYYQKIVAPPAAPVRDAAIWFHRVGQAQDQDLRIFGGTDRADYLYYIETKKTSDGRELLMIYQSQGSTNNSHVWTVDAAAPTGTQPKAPVEVVKTDDARHYFVDERPGDGRMYMYTDKDAPNGKIVLTRLEDAGDPSKWQEILPSDPAAQLMDEKIIGDRIVASWLVGSHDEVRVYDLDGKLLQNVALPTAGAVFGITPKPGDEKNSALLWFSSYIYPATFLSLNAQTGQVDAAPFWAASIPGFVPSDFEMKTVQVKSKDGTLVPVDIVHKKGIKLDGSSPSPAWVSAYAGFGNIAQQAYASVVTWLLQQGFVYAWVRARGGGEAGEQWHRAGAGPVNKPNSVDDVAAAVSFLHQNGYSKPELTGVTGESNGGLLMGMLAMQYPELVRFANLINPVLDMAFFLKLSQDGVNWVPEYGDPRKKADLVNILDWSPQDWAQFLRALKVTILLHYGKHDDRVGALHALEFALTRQEAQPKELRADYPTLLNGVDTGHAGTLPNDVLVKRTALTYALLYRALGLPPPAPLP